VASLLVGNGVNYLGSGNVISWENLLKELIRSINKEGVIDMNEKPFLHIYEEIYTRELRYTNTKETTIKQRIFNALATTTANEYHQKITSIGFKNIMTTNYEYFLTPDSQRKNSETKYSLFRYQTHNNQKVWHIHGELNNLDSLMLGYDHYMGSINNMQTYLHKKKKDTDKQSWVDIFLNDDIYILGLGLDFGEIDLWWLLSYRNREILAGNIDKKKIVYIDMVENQKDIAIAQTSENDFKNKPCEKQIKEAINNTKEKVEAQIKYQQNKAKLSMLEVLGVTVEKFYYEDRERQFTAYDDAINFMNKELKG